MPALPQTTLTPPERRLVGLLALSRPAQAADTLHLPLEEVEALLADLLRRHGLSTQHQLLARALLHRWL